MPKVFYSGQSRSPPPPEREWLGDGTGSEAETDIESGGTVERSSRPKAVHRRTESMEATSQIAAPPKRTRRTGNAVFLHRQPSRKIRDATGQRPLQKACARGDADLVRTLLANSPDLQDRDYAGTTALHTAALQGDEDIVSALLNAGAVVDVRSGPEELDTPLMDAAANGFLSTVERLLAAGADPRVSNATGRIAIDFVQESDDNSDAILQVLNAKTKELRSKGAPVIASPTHPDAPDGLFPPGFAGVQRPAAPIFLDVSKRSARHEIVEHAATGDLEYVGFALERGWRPTPEALVKAAKYGHSEVVGLLLAFGLDADASSSGTTALNEAIQRCHLATVKLLIDSGAKLKSGYADLVDDLPEWDELRAIVRGTKPGERPPKPARSEPAPIQESGDVAKDGLVKPLETTEATKKILTEKPITKSADTPRDAMQENSQSIPVKSEQPELSSQGRDSTKHTEGRLNRRDPEVETNKKETNDRKHSSVGDLKLSKVDLRSIKPKKRSKSVADSLAKDSTPPLPSDVSASPVVRPDPTTPKPIESEPPQSESTEAVAFGKSKIVGSDTEESTAPQQDVAHLKPVVSGSREDSPRNSSPIPTARSPALNESSRETTPVSSEVWAERSQELNELAERKAKERRDREARMLESLAQEQRRRSDTQQQDTPVRSDLSKSDSEPKLTNTDASSSNETVEPSIARAEDPSGTRKLSNSGVTASSSPSNTGQDPQASEGLNNQTKEDESKDQKEVSVTQLPWVLRNLAYTAEPQHVSPLLVHKIANTDYFIDLQVALSSGKPQLHSKHPNLTKVLITSPQKQFLWSFCRPWLCRPGSTSEEVADDRQKFLDLGLCWIPRKEVETQHVFDNLSREPRMVYIQLEPEMLRPRPVNSDLPLRWQARANIAGRAW